MKTHLTQVTAFGFFLNFNGSVYDYNELIHMLVERGFVRRFPQIGYLIAKGQPFMQNKESLEHHTRLIESDPEQISVMGKYSVVSCIPINSGKEIVIGHHPDTPKSKSNSSEILKEVVTIIDLIKDKAGHENLVPCKLFTAISVKTEKRPYQVLINANIKKLPRFEKMLPDMEVVRWENEVYLYSANIERTGGPTPIIEDMKLKRLPRQIQNRKRSWDQIIFKPRPGEYDISMNYMTDDLNDLTNVFKETESLSVAMINELENVMDF